MVFVSQRIGEAPEGEALQASQHRYNMYHLKMTMAEPDRAKLMFREVEFQWKPAEITMIALCHAYARAGEQLRYKSWMRRSTIDTTRTTLGQPNHLCLSHIHSLWKYFYKLYRRGSLEFLVRAQSHVGEIARTLVENGHFGQAKMWVNNVSFSIPRFAESAHEAYLEAVASVNPLHGYYVYRRTSSEHFVSPLAKAGALRSLSYTERGEEVLL